MWILFGAGRRSLKALSWALALISTPSAAVGLAEPLFALLDPMLPGQILERRWLVRQHRPGESIATRMLLVARRLKWHSDFQDVCLSVMMAA
jgi:hypothetical protein